MNYQRNINLLGAPCEVALKSVKRNNVLPDFIKVYGKPSKIKFTNRNRITKSGIQIFKKVTLDYPGISSEDFTKFIELTHDFFELVLTYNSGEVFQVATKKVPMKLTTSFSGSGTKITLENKDVTPVKFLNGTVTTSEGNSTLTIIQPSSQPILTEETNIDLIKQPGQYYFKTSVYTLNDIKFTDENGLLVGLNTISKTSDTLEGAVLTVSGKHFDDVDGVEHLTQTLVFGYNGSKFTRQFNSEENDWYKFHDLTASGEGGGDDYLTVSKGVIVKMTTTGIYYQTPLVTPIYENINSSTGQTTLTALYPRHDIPDFVTFPFDVKLKGVSVVNGNGRGDTITLGIFSNERQNGVPFYSATALNGQTVAELDMVMAGVQAQGIFDFDTSNGINDVVIPKGAGIKVVSKSSSGSSFVKQLTITLNFQRL